MSEIAKDSKTIDFNSLQFYPLLSKKYKKFVTEFVSCHNGAEAARRVGYASGSASVQSARIMKKPHVQEAITEIQNLSLTKTIVEQDELKDIASQMIRATHEDFLGAEDVIDVSSPRAKAVAHAVKKIRVKRQGSDVTVEELELVDKKPLMEFYARLNGWLDKDTGAGSQQAVQINLNLAGDKKKKEKKVNAKGD
jgi:phage terminase small subunit